MTGFSELRKSRTSRDLRVQLIKALVFRGANLFKVLRPVGRAGGEGREPES